MLFLKLRRKFLLQVEVILYDPQLRHSSLFWMLQTKVDMFFVTSDRSAAAAGAWSESGISWKERERVTYQRTS